MRGKGQDVSTSLVTFPSPGVEPSKGESKLFVAGTDTTYFLLPRVTNILIRLEKRPDINCLPSPNVSVHSPVQGELQGPSVEGSIQIDVRKWPNYPIIANLRDSVNGHSKKSKID